MVDLLQIFGEDAGCQQALIILTRIIHDAYSEDGVQCQFNNPTSGVSLANFVGHFSVLSGTHIRLFPFICQDVSVEAFFIVGDVLITSSCSSDGNLQRSFTWRPFRRPCIASS